jgi:hypothetical protein
MTGLKKGRSGERMIGDLAEDGYGDGSKIGTETEREG